MRSFVQLCLWILLIDRAVTRIYVAPGNGGTAQDLDKVSNVSIQVEDFPGQVKFAKEHDINFVVPGPEVPLVAGVTDFFKNSTHSTSEIPRLTNDGQ